MIRVVKIFIQWILVVWGILVLTIVVLIIKNWGINQHSLFDAEQFQSEGNYTDDELLLFADIAFIYNRIRKWEEDIKVEIKNIDQLAPWEIAEVDSVIDICAPLIYPLKIYRVSEGGNLFVNHRVDFLPEMEGNNGFCRTNNFIPSFTWKINRTTIYDIVHKGTPRTLLHEFEHALGLSHPSQVYPFYMIIMPGTSRIIFKSIEESDAYKDLPFYHPEIEKKIIRMLYSPHIKSGLRRSNFMKKMKLKDL